MFAGQHGFTPWSTQFQARAKPLSAPRTLVTGLCERPVGFLQLFRTSSGCWFQPLLKNISQWEGLSRILWKIKNVWNHQPVMVFSEQLIQFILTAFIRVLASIPISARGKPFGNGPSKAFGLPDLALCWCDGSGCCRCPGWSCLGRLGYRQPFYVIYKDISNHVMRMIYVYIGIYWDILSYNLLENPKDTHWSGKISGLPLGQQKR